MNAGDGGAEDGVRSITRLDADQDPVATPEEAPPALGQRDNDPNLSCTRSIASGRAVYGLRGCSALSSLKILMIAVMMRAMLIPKNPRTMKSPRPVLRNSLPSASSTAGASGAAGALCASAGAGDKASAAAATKCLNVIVNLSRPFGSWGSSLF